MRALRSLITMTIMCIAFIAALTAISPAETLLSEPQALQLVFPKSQSVVTEIHTLSAEQRASLEKSTGLHFSEKDFRCFVGHDKQGIDGYAVIMNEVGKHEYITFIVGVTARREVSDVAVMEYRETRGWEVKEQRFLRQFHGKKATDPITVDRDIVNYTGATLSSHAVARGVKKALVLVNQFYPPTQAPAK
jgi:Na+-translocating ferredoxin:NAD+ oxidoreductase RnfG subunit